MLKIEYDPCVSSEHWEVKDAEFECFPCSNFQQKNNVIPKYIAS